MAAGCGTASATASVADSAVAAARAHRADCFMLPGFMKPFHPMSNALPALILTRRIILTLLLGGLVLLSYMVLQIFLVPLAWAAILAFSTWPLYTGLQRVLRGGPTLRALIMTLLLTAAVVLPLLWLMVLLRGEVSGAYATVLDYLSQGSYALPERIARLPWLGDWLQQALDLWVSDPAVVRAQIAQWLEARTGEILNILGDVGRNAGKFAFALITLFFLYRDGESLLRQVRHVLRRFLGQRVEGYLAAVGGMTKAVVWGLVATALVQGLVAGLGYWWAGLDAPVLLGSITALVAMIPFGTPFVWGSIGVWLILTGEASAGIGLLVWGALVVSWVDNLIRPLVISSATRIPFLLVMFGVLGGLAAFGLIGLFLGPVILAVLVAVWREWLEESHIGRDDASPPSTPIRSGP
jgi:predicted PurR-regulated permease PerM